MLIPSSSTFPPIRKKLAIAALIASLSVSGLWVICQFVSMTKTEAIVVGTVPLIVSYNHPTEAITIRGIVSNKVYSKFNEGDKVRIGYLKNGVLRPQVIQAVSFWVPIKVVVMFPFVLMLIYGILDILIKRN